MMASKQLKSVLALYNMVYICGVPILHGHISVLIIQTEQPSSCPNIPFFFINSIYKKKKKGKEKDHFLQGITQTQLGDFKLSPLFDFFVLISNSLFSDFSYSTPNRTASNFKNIIPHNPLQKIKNSLPPSHAYTHIEVSSSFLPILYFVYFFYFL